MNEIKVICIRKHTQLEIGKIYSAVRVNIKDHSGYRMIGESGWLVVVDDKFEFVIPLAEWREQQINSILDE
jgi:hypothetical protein